MTIESQIKIDMAQHGIPPIVNAMQSDANTRVVKVSLFANGVPFVPDGCAVSVVYKKPDGTSGWYDKLPDETEAVSVTDNVVTAILAPQVLTAPGNVYAAIRLDAAPNRISSFPFIVSVAADPGNNAVKSENYYSVQNWDEVNSAIDRLDQASWHTVTITYDVLEKAVSADTSYWDIVDLLNAGRKVNAVLLLPDADGKHIGEYQKNTSSIEKNTDLNVQFRFPGYGVITVDSDNVWSYIANDTVTQEQLEDAVANASSIDDTAVGAAAWSSRNIVDKLCPTFTESGAAVSVAPMEGYPLSVVSAIEPVQEGSGDPSPDNVRPITGFDSVKLWRGGKNLLPYPYVDKTVTRSGITFTDNGDGTITANGTATSAASFVLTEALPATEAFGRLIMSGCPAGGSVATYSITNVQTGHKDTGSGYTFRCDKNHKRWRITIGAGTTVSNLVFKPQIELGTVATEYEPYRGHTFTAQLGQTVYGGSLNWQTGVLTVDKICIMPGSDGWLYSEGPGCFVKDISEYTLTGEQICSHFTYNSNIPSGAGVLGFCIVSGTAYACVPSISDEAEFKAYLEALEVTGTPLQFMSSLAEPVTIQLTPQEILALSGENTLTSDTGDTTVSGRANLITLVTKLQETVAAQAAQISTLQAAAVNNA